MSQAAEERLKLTKLIIELHEKVDDMYWYIRRNN